MAGTAESLTVEPEMVAAVFIEGRLVRGRPTG
jgi:hypothetical protein